MENRNLEWGLFLALLLHIMIWWLDLLPTSESQVKPDVPITVESWKDSRPTVQTSRVDSNDPSKKADFVGEYQQRVQKEIIAKNRGKFKEGSPTPSEQGQEGLQNLLPPASQPYHIPGKAEGQSTLLNTDSVKYASFVNRIAEIIYDPWVRYARAAAEKNASELQPRTYVTKLEIRMDDKGNITEITVLQSCGISALDEAPKRAFWENSPMRNPPAQMMAADGYLHFVYEFHFEWRTSNFQIVPWL